MATVNANTISFCLVLQLVIKLSQIEHLEKTNGCIIEENLHLWVDAIESHQPDWTTQPISDLYIFVFNPNTIGIN